MALLFFKIIQFNLFFCFCKRKLKLLVNISLNTMLMMMILKKVVKQSKTIVLFLKNI